MNIDVYGRRPGCDLVDCNGYCLAAYRLGAGGAVLERPNGFVAWRVEWSTPDAESSLAAAIEHVLYKHAGTSPSMAGSSPVADNR